MHGGVVWMERDYVMDRDDEQRLGELIRESQAADAAEHFRPVVYRKLRDLFPHRMFAYSTVDVKRSCIVSFVNYSFPGEGADVTRIPQDPMTSHLVRKWLDVLEPIYFEPRKYSTTLPGMDGVRRASFLPKLQGGHIPNLALHGMVDIRRKLATCFIFGGIDRPWDRQTKSILRSVIPYLHSVLCPLAEEESDGGTPMLSARERDVLTLLARGRTDAGIAEKLGISVCTVRIHVRSILRKMNARNRTQAVVKALRSQLVE
jgi:DNA-binding CsgD family transcriptional regulator